MSLQLLNDFILDIKVHSIQSTIPIGGGGSIPDNSILNIKLVDKTIENTKIKDGTIISSLLDNDLTINNNLTVNGPTFSLPNGDLNVGVNITAGQTITGSILSATTEVNTPYLFTTSLYINNGVGSYLTNGTGTLGGGGITIATSAIAANSIVLLTRTTDPTVDAGFLAVMNIFPGVNFDVVSSTSADNGTFSWLIINPA
jgi:hypothetical protein